MLETLCILKANLKKKFECAIFKQIVCSQTQFRYSYMTHLLFTLIRTQFALPNPTSDYGQTVHAQSDN